MVFCPRRHTPPDVEGATSTRRAPEKESPPREPVMGASPRRLAPLEVHKPIRNLSNADIAGSSPASQYFSTARCVNPVNPHYHYVTALYDAAPPPRFLRDSYDVSDIPGATPRRPIQREVRAVLNVDDVAGAKPTVHIKCERTRPAHVADLWAGSV